MRTFYLGTANTAWLWDGSVDVPLFLSDERLKKRVHLKPATAPSWGLDSGGYMEIKKHGCWRGSPEDYAGRVRRYAAEIGALDFAAIQDWMCEPWIIERSGLSVGEHQKRTIQSYQDLTRIAPEIPWLPVLQGWDPSHYIEHIRMYEAAGIHLDAHSLVGLGSVCRREAMDEAGEIIKSIRREIPKIKLHGFGFKTDGLKRFANLLETADSMAWSDRARRKRYKSKNCKAKHKVCNDCRVWAQEWRSSVMEKEGSAPCGQLGFFSEGMFEGLEESSKRAVIRTVRYCLDDMEGRAPDLEEAMQLVRLHDKNEEIETSDVIDIATRVVDYFSMSKESLNKPSLRDPREVELIYLPQ